MSADDDTTLLYFGCIGESGHYLWSSPYRRTRDIDETPWGMKIDGKLCPPADPWGRNGQPQGRAALHHKDGWTALAFWDRSVDKRPGSNSVFVADECLSFDQIVTVAKERFPGVWKRLAFDVTPQTTDA